MAQDETFLRKLRNLFLTGLAIIFPIVATVWVLITLFNMVDGILGSIIYPMIGIKVPGLGFISTFLFVIWIGSLTRNIIGNAILSKLEQLIERMPLVKNIYNPARQLVKTFSSTGKASFRKVVMVEYPRKDMWALGFLTNEEGYKGLRTDGREMGQNWVCIFLPTSPNPTSGYFVMVPRKDIKILDITVEQGVRMIISGGVITP
ncbi:DUF502 domain-containing protein [Candidatus Margulisiibacteriota bacterium]